MQWRPVPRFVVQCHIYTIHVVQAQSLSLQLIPLPGCTFPTSRHFTLPQITLNHETWYRPPFPFAWYRQKHVSPLNSLNYIPLSSIQTSSSCLHNPPCPCLNNSFGAVPLYPYLAIFPTLTTQTCEIRAALYHLYYISPYSRSALVRVVQAPKTRDLSPFTTFTTRNLLPIGHSSPFTTLYHPLPTPLYHLYHAKLAYWLP